MHAISEEHFCWVTEQDENEVDDLERAAKLIAFAVSEMNTSGRTKRYYSLKRRACYLIHGNDWKLWLSA